MYISLYHMSCLHMVSSLHQIFSVSYIYSCLLCLSLSPYIPSLPFSSHYIPIPILSLISSSFCRISLLSLLFSPIFSSHISLSLLILLLLLLLLLFSLLYLLFFPLYFLPYIFLQSIPPCAVG